MTSLRKPDTAGVAMLVLTATAAKRPDAVAKHDDAIIARMKTDAVLAVQGGQVLVPMASLSEVSDATILADRWIGAYVNIHAIFVPRALALPQLFIPHNEARKDERRRVHI